MRVLVTLLSFLLAGAASAQEAYGSFGLGPSTDGVALRLAGGIGSGPVSPTFRLMLGGEVGLSESVESESRSRAEVGVGLARVQPLGGAFRVEGHLGVALAFASVDDGDRGGFLNFPDLGFGVTAPLEVTALMRITDRAELGLTATRSLTLAHGSSEDDPDLRLRVPSLQQSALSLGIRFR